MDSLPVFAGARLQRSIALSDGMRLSPNLSLAFVHEFEPARNLVATFGSTSTAAFIVAGARPDHNMLQAKVGVSLQMNAAVSVFAKFEGEYGARTQSYAGKGGLKVA